MDAFAQSINSTLRKRGIVFNKALLTKGILPRLRCELPAGCQIVPWDADTVVVKVMEVMAAAPKLSEDVLDTTVDSASPFVEQSGETRKMTEEQNKGGEQQKAESDRRAEFMKVAEEVAAKIARADPTKVRPSRFERQGPSWSIVF